MGYETVWVLPRVTAHVSRHNSDKDREHDALAEELGTALREAVSDIINHPRYQPINPTLEG